MAVQRSMRARLLGVCMAVVVELACGGHLISFGVQRSLPNVRRLLLHSPLLVVSPVDLVFKQLVFLFKIANCLLAVLEAVVSGLLLDGFLLDSCLTAYCLIDNVFHG